MTEELWFILILWVLLLLVSQRSSGKVIGAFAGMVGVFFGFMLFAEIGFWLGIIMVFFNLYVMYGAVFGGKE